ERSTTRRFAPSPVASRSDLRSTGDRLRSTSPSGRTTTAPSRRSISTRIVSASDIASLAGRRPLAADASCAGRARIVAAPRLGKPPDHRQPHTDMVAALVPHFVHHFPDDVHAQPARTDLLDRTRGDRIRVDLLGLVLDHDLY